jgi:hypothetical protein
MLHHTDQKTGMAHLMHTKILNNVDISELARFKLLMRKVHDYRVDLTLLSTDADYARSTLDLAEDTDHEELMLLAVQLRSRLGLLGQTAAEIAAAMVAATPPPVVEPATPPEPDASKDTKNQRYRFSLR